MASMSIPVKMSDGSTYLVKQLLGKGDGNTKLRKSDKAKKGFMTVGLSLSPANSSGYELCPNRSPGCTQACLAYAGYGQVHAVQHARIAKARLFMQERPTFMAMLYRDIAFFWRRATKRNQRLAVRLNMLSDIPWEKIDREMFNTFADVQFYDYTKQHKRMGGFELSREHNDETFFPLNYHLTFSRSETNLKESSTVYTYKYSNVAVVFGNANLPKRYAGREVIDGDKTDLRFLDKSGVIVGLNPKGIRGRNDTSGFVVKLALLQR